MRKFSKLVLLSAVFMLVSTEAFAIDVKINGAMQQWFAYSDGASFTDNAGVASKSGDFSFYADKSTFTGLSYSSANYNGVKGKTDVQESDFSPITRYRQWFTVSSDDQKVRAVWAVEIGGLKWGYQGDSVGKSKGSGYSGDGVNIETRWLYTDFEVPGIGGRAVAGLQTVPLAKDFGQFIWTENAAGLIYFRAIGPVDFNLGWLRGDAKQSKNIGGDKGYDNAYYIDLGLNFSRNRLALVALQLTKLGETSSSGSYAYNDKQLYVGASGKFNAGPVSADVTGVYQDGTVNLKTPTPQKLNRAGYIGNANLTLKVADKHKITLGYLYASGDGNAADNEVSNYSAVDVDMSHGVVFFEGPVSESYVTDSPYWLDKGLSMPSIRYDFQPLKSLVLSGVYSYINTAKNTQRIGAATVNAGAGPNGKTYGSEIGNEVDLLIKYNVWQGLDAYFGIGYLRAGNALDAYTNDGREKAANIVKSQLELVYKF